MDAVRLHTGLTDRRDSADGSTVLVVAHRFGGEDTGTVSVPLPAGTRLPAGTGVSMGEAVFGHRPVAAAIDDGMLTVHLDEPFSAVALLLSRTP